MNKIVVWIYEIMLIIISYEMFEGIYYKYLLFSLNVKFI